MGLRKALLSFIADFANWDHSTDLHYLKTSRALVKAAHPEETPLVVDPFAGGGSIPLEALRLGCEAFASDLNPVACLILKVMLEDIPRFGPDLAKELRRVGTDIKKQAEEKLSEFYPVDPDGARPIAYLWARTVRCEAPNCGAEIPLMRSFWLCKKTNRKRALRYKIIRLDNNPPRVEFEIFEPKIEQEIPNSTITRAKATCPCCGTVFPPERVRSQLTEQRGGADVIFDKKGSRIGGARLLVVVSIKLGEVGRQYRLPTLKDYESVWKAQKRLKAILGEWERGGKKGFCPVPDEPTPWAHGHRSVGSPRVYGMKMWRDLFSSRQGLALSEIAKHIKGAVQERTARPLVLVFSKLAELANSLCPWEPYAECPRHVFARHDLPMAWDFAEGVPTSISSGSFDMCCGNVANSLNSVGAFECNAVVQTADARHSSLPTESANVWFTDPPYYDAIAYSDLSDLFHVWIKRAMPFLAEVGPISNNGLTPKEEELTVTTVSGEDAQPKDRAFFESGMSLTFCEGRRVLRENDIATVVFAHKTTEGWEALLSGAVRAGWTITASWPITTEMGSRLNARETASLSASIHLICRPRPEGAPVGDWGDVLRELPKRVGEWMERLQKEGIRGADLVFACIGPALEIFSRYSKVETAEGKEVTLAEYLEKVWEVVGRTALEHVLGTAEARARNSAAGALEEDARLTALFLWTLQSSNGEGESKKPKGKSEEIEDDEGIEHEDEAASSKSNPKGFSLIFDVVRRFAQPLGIILPHWEGRIIETKKGIVRLLSLTERAKILFGEAGAHTVADRIESDREGSPQLSLFPEIEVDAVPHIRGRGKSRDSRQVAGMTDQALQTKREATTLDRVHAAMLLQAGGRANALRSLLKAEQDRGPDFLRLANALSALYPKSSEEKRLLDAMLLAMPR